jgi:hypothetical protein
MFGIDFAECAGDCHCKGFGLTTDPTAIKVYLYIIFSLVVGYLKGFSNFELQDRRRKIILEFTAINSDNS